MLNTLTLLNVTIFMTFACHTKIHDKGLLTLQEKNLLLTNIDGEIYHVHAGKDKVYLKQLEGCIIHIEGSRLMQHVFVDVCRVYEIKGVSNSEYGMVSDVIAFWYLAGSCDGYILLPIHAS